MTAPAARSWDDQAREQIAAAMVELWTAEAGGLLAPGETLVGEVPAELREALDFYLAHLLPVVSRLVAQARTEAAAELEAAATDVEGGYVHDVPSYLRARAAALRATSTETGDQT